MKRAFIGAWLSLLGTIWGGAVLVAASQNLVNSWDPQLGRMMTTVIQRHLLFPLLISVLLILLGLAIMAVEFFRK